MIVGGRFEIVREAGSGGMGIVYMARDGVTGKAVALKVLGDKTNDRRFTREAEVLAQLEHPAIVGYVAHGARSDDGPPYLAMEWLEGEDLATRLEREPLSVSEAITLCVRIADAVGTAHQRGIIHRDLKPSNVFLVSKRVDAAKVLDFGLARDMTSDRPLTQVGAVMGSVGYLSPEQARGAASLDARSDVFSLGCILFECLTGKPAFSGAHAVAILAKLLVEDAPRAKQANKDVPASVDSLVASMLERNPERRPVDGHTVRDALLRIADPESMSGIRPRATARPAALTRDEQRVMAVILVGERSSAPSGSGSVGDTSPAAATMIALRTQGARAAIDEAIAAFEGVADIAADGTVVVTLRGGGAATDQALRGARCALALTTVCPGSVIALALGRGIADSGPVAGEVIERAAALLAGALGDHSDAVHVEPSVVPLLEARFVVAPGGSGTLLHAERHALESARMLLGRVTPFVGRAREITMLEHTFATTVVEREASAAMVVGPAGSGKSRLREELTRAAKRRDPSVVVWVAQGDPLRMKSAFAATAAIVRAACGVDATSPPGTQRDALRAGVLGASPDPERERVVCFLAEMLGCPFDTAQNAPLRLARESIELMHDQITRAWVDFTLARLAQTPLLVILEDLHWIDAPSVKLLEVTLGRARDLPLMVVGLGRPEVVEMFPSLWAEHGAQTVHLGPISPRASEKLAREALAGVEMEIDDRVIARLVERAAGNPFVLEELVRAHAERPNDDAALPDGVLALVQARLEGLAPSLRRVLRAASIYGRNARAEGVARLLGDEDAIEIVRSSLRALVQREVLEIVGDDESLFRFRHDLVRDAAYAMLTATDRSVGHALAATWLEGSGEHDASVLGMHYDLGGDTALAAIWYARAAEQSLDGNEFDATVAHAKHALDLGVTGELRGRALHARSMAERWRGDCTAGLADAKAAIAEFHEGSGMWFAAVVQACILGDTIGLRDDVRELVVRVLAVPAADARAAALRIRAIGEAATSRYHAGDHVGGDELVVRLETEAEAHGDDPLVALTLHRLRALHASNAGDHAAELEQWIDIGKRYADMGDRRGAAIAGVNSGYGWMMVGNYEKAEATLRDVVETAGALHLLRAVGAARHNLGLVLAHRGDFEGAVREETQALEAMTAAHDDRLTATSRVYLATILEMAGDLTAAEKVGREGLLGLEQLPPLRPRALAILARIMLRIGGIAEAERLSAAACEALGVARVEGGDAFPRLVRVEALIATDRMTDAKEALRDAKRALDRAAARIGDEAIRASYLDNVPEHARTLALARQYGVE